MEGRPINSSLSSAAGDCPKLGAGLLWEEKDVNQLGIFWQYKSWRDIMSQKANFDFSQQKLWKKVVDVFIKLMDTVPLEIDNAESTTITDILTLHRPTVTSPAACRTTSSTSNSSPARKKAKMCSGPGCSDCSSTTASHTSASETLLSPKPPSFSGVSGDESELKVKERLDQFIRRIGETRRQMKTQALEYGIIADPGSESGLPGVAAFAIFSEHVGMFLDALVNMLINQRHGISPTETAFQHLFQVFTRIFMISFSPGNNRLKRQMTIFGFPVACQPDLRLEQCLVESSSVSIVSVAEVQKSASSPCPNMNEITGGACESSHPAKWEKVEDLTSRIKGKHTAELLLELPFSVLKVQENKMCILGLIVQATKVRLTCLEIDQDHFKQLREPTYRPLKKDCRATVYYSEAFDMLVKMDWDNLVKLMITLASIGHQSVRPLNSSLLWFLPLRGHNV